MYLPKHFEVTDQAVLHDLMRRFSFATLVTVHEGRPVAGHLPFMLDSARGEYGTLIAHMARANRQWSAFAEAGAEALVIFQGPHTYISPSWYDVHPSVPTWNYAAIHAYGTPYLIEDENQVRAALRALVEVHEQGFETPWTMDLPEDYLGKMSRGIVAFEIPIARLEGKFKLSQNRSAHDRERVIAALTESADPLAQGVRTMMEANR